MAETLVMQKTEGISQSCLSQKQKEKQKEREREEKGGLQGGRL